MIYVIVTLTMRPDSLSSLSAEVDEIVSATRAEPGCLFYDLSISMADPDRWIFVEKWADREAHNAHLEQPHMKNWRQAAAAWVEKRQLEIVVPAHVETI